MNPEVGELQIEVGGEKILLRPSMYGIRQVRELIGVSIFGVGENLRDPKTVDPLVVAGILYAGYLGGIGEKGTPKWTFDEFGELLIAEGLSKLLMPAVKFVKYGMAGSEKKMAIEGSDSGG